MGLAGVVEGCSDAGVGEESVEDVGEGCAVSFGECAEVAEAVGELVGGGAEGAAGGAVEE